ncbi:hypothetical protein NGB36_01515 [Streptomyces sp. RB6PN25]|uniref:Uncharacterized protein n=1 Tax=Streptomyces humicola TaxID=2953240 RepID=A0ABT1PNR8_9ACTN|nr:hypothetical protein [Streptomyces humicola]MCQ4079316.1 hypothetical protein [Streptomyces humicola]
MVSAIAMLVPAPCHLSARRSGWAAAGRGTLVEEAPMPRARRGGGMEVGGRD